MNDQHPYTTISGTLVVAPQLDCLSSDPVLFLLRDARALYTFTSNCLLKRVGLWYELNKD